MDDLILSHSRNRGHNENREIVILYKFLSKVICETTVSRILKTNGFHPYKVHIAPSLNASDFETHLNVC